MTNMLGKKLSLLCFTALLFQQMPSLAETNKPGARIAIGVFNQLDEIDLATLDRISAGKITSTGYRLADLLSNLPQSSKMNNPMVVLTTSNGSRRILKLDTIETKEMKLHYESRFLVVGAKQGTMDDILSIVIADEEDLDHLQVLAPRGAQNSLTVKGFGVFAKNCSTCHGIYGKGNRGIAPDLGDVTTYRSEAHIKNMMLQGRTGRMPSFRDILTTEDMDAAFQYLRAKSQDANDLRPNVAASGPLSLGKWRVAKGSPVIDAWRFEDIYFPDQINGWIVNWKGQVFKSDDGGENWRPQARLKGALRSVRFMDSKIGIIGSIDDAGIFRTEDGGETWVELKAGENFFQGVCGLSHFGKSFFGVGRFDKDSNFYKSTDKGITWIKKDLRHLATSLVDVHFVNHRVGFVTGHGAKPGQGAVILRTDDGGENFRVAYATNDAIDFHVWKLNFINEKVIVGSIWTNDKRSAAYMIRSEDGGATWTRQLVSKDYFYVEGIGFLNATVGWMGGGKGLYETRDAGKTWTFLDFGHSVNRFFRVGSKVFAAGKGVYIYEN